MSDWEFLHEMHNDGYSPEQIADAAACGYNAFEWQPAIENELPVKKERPDPELAEIFSSLVDNLKTYHAITGRYLQIWGELGELYAEVTYGIKRHKPHTKGSDGTLGNDFIEIKTMSPERAGEQVQVKRAGNFSKLLVVKISGDLTFEGQFLTRKKLPKGKGSHARVSWHTLTTANEMNSGDRGA